MLVIVMNTEILESCTVAPLQFKIKFDCFIPLIRQHMCALMLMCI